MEGQTDGHLSPIYPENC